MALELREADTVPLMLLTGLEDWEGEPLKEGVPEALELPELSREAEGDRLCEVLTVPLTEALRLWLPEPLKECVPELLPLPRLLREADLL